ncbi:hypothetical protein [Helicobacter cappadocius]|uniref:TraG N-terminal Proteobacteria domain-containing protein n=1 Tax=Helicobacter cappadocius TaxID=3063998 RepID=A0AA90PKR3_9HELI|nr:MULTISPECIES: hypothetical protein [unclassified Helicobacter]MDO7253848.1 hypothetical protein [Helicobacter sp. faydin-H75]MDP2539806.1 hypothetical protein [Helicobacter sp. faydin-H76]
MEIFMRKIPTLLNYFETIALSVFPFFLLSILATGGIRAIQMFAIYIGGMGGVVLNRVALALTHDFYTNITAKNLSSKVMGMSQSFVEGNSIETVYDQSYFNYLTEQSGLLGMASCGAAIIVTTVVIYGTWKAVTTLGAMYAQSIASQVQDATALKAQKIDSEVQQQMQKTTGESPLDMKLKQDLMKGIEQNNAAFVDLQKYNQAQQYSAGQIAQGTQQIASMTTLGQDAMDNGLGHAKALGTDQAVRQIGTAKGMMSSGVYDSDGNLNNNREANLYQQGLENQSRIGANKTIGVGKENLTTDKMNAIQYGAQAGVESEIASGRSLKNTYGTDLKGSARSGSKSFSEVSEINSTKSNIDSAANAAGTVANAKDGEDFWKKWFQEARNRATKRTSEELGAGESAGDQIEKLGGGTKGIKKLKNTARSLGNKQTDESIGSAEGYDAITKDGYDSTDKDGNKVHHDADPDAFKNSAKISTQAQGASVSKKLEGEKNKALEANENEKIETEKYNNDLLVKSNNGFDSIIKDIQGSLEKQKEIAFRGSDADTTDTLTREKLNKAISDKAEVAEDINMTNAMNAKTFENRKQKIQAKSSSDFLNNVSENIAAVDGLNYSQMASNVQAAQNLGILSQTGNITASGMQMHDVASASKYGDMMAQQKAWSNTGNQQKMIDDLMGIGVSRDNLKDLIKAKGNASAFAAEYKSKFGVVNINSMINGRRTAKSMSASGGAFEGGMFEGEHHAINTRTSLTGGYTANMGEAGTFGAVVGVKAQGDESLDAEKEAMQIWGVTKTAYNGVKDTIGIVKDIKSGFGLKDMKGNKGDTGTPTSGQGSGVKGDG